MALRFCAPSNGAAAKPHRPTATVTIEELVRRKVSTVRLNGKLYRVECKEIEERK